MLQTGARFNNAKYLQTIYVVKLHRQAGPFPMRFCAVCEIGKEFQSIDTALMGGRMLTDPFIPRFELGA